MATTDNTITTPKGIAQYPWLSKPDTKFSEEGEYKVNVILVKEEAQDMIDTINTIFAENVQAETKKAKGKEVKTSNPPYANELDDDGKPTGNVILKFKSKAAYPPAIFDSKGDLMKESNIWGGSEVKVNGYVAPYFTSMVGAGVALRLRAVQVIQYVEGSQGAGRFGFEEEVGGFVQETPKTPETFEEVVATTEAPKELVQITEPTVRKEAPSSIDKSDDISGIIDKWSTKD
tara:strand:+ start:929 stop:1624 length:696 start_codon:yes stop_codon:yes gene_type:complete